MLFELSSAPRGVVAATVPQLEPAHKLIILPFAGDEMGKALEDELASLLLKSKYCRVISRDWVKRKAGPVNCKSADCFTGIGKRLTGDWVLCAGREGAMLVVELLYVADGRTVFSSIIPFGEGAAARGELLRRMAEWLERNSGSGSAK